jgi:hypothetical protein
MSMISRYVPQAATSAPCVLRALVRSRYVSDCDIGLSIAVVFPQRGGRAKYFISCALQDARRAVKAAKKDADAAALKRARQKVYQLTHYTRLSTCGQDHRLYAGIHWTGETRIQPDGDALPLLAGPACKGGARRAGARVVDRRHTRLQPPNGQKHGVCTMVGRAGGNIRNWMNMISSPAQRI